MPYEMSWYIEKRVIGMRFYGDVTVEEVVETGTNIAPFLPESIPPLYMIVDTLEVTKYPTDFKNMVLGMQGNSQNSTKFERTVIISDNRLINFFSTMISGVFNMPIRAYKTRQEAEAYLAHHAEDLAPLFAERNASTASTD